jgi:hypothetical protein
MSAGWGVLLVLAASCSLLLASPAAGTAGLPAAGADAAGPGGGVALHVIPFPNTPDASPRSDIIFSSLRPADLSGTPVVVGSISGTHSGRLTGLPDHAGTAFVPSRPFVPGESVAVRADLINGRAGTASGDPGATHLRFSFAIAVAGSGQVSATPSQARGATDAGTSRPTFRSAPGLDPPPVHVSRGPAPGARDIFLSPSGGSPGMMILNRRGQLVWFHPLRGASAAANLEVQGYHGRSVLTWWQGTFQDGRGTGGEDVILNRAYHRIAVVRPGWGYASDQHEFQITPQGTALVDAYVPVRADLRRLGGSRDGTLADCVVQEVDIRTGTVLWEWHALGHVPLSSSYLHPPPSSVYDPFHLNSVQQLPGHRLLLSFRHTWAVYEIDQPTGRVVWTLGGKRSSFTMGKGTRFEWQHDAHLYGAHLLTVFDDAASPQEEPESSAKELRLKSSTHRVSLVRRFWHSPPLLASTQGSAQLLPDHDMFVGWGSAPYFSEYTSAGRQVFDASFPLTSASYRAYRFAWTGDPVSRPALALSRSKRGVIWARVSWNGATQIARWRVLGGSAGHAPRALKTKRWSGFETAIALPGAPSRLLVEGLDAHGRVLGRSLTESRP